MNPERVDRLLTAHQHVLPQRLLSQLARRLSFSRAGWLKNLFIRAFIRLFKVDMAEAASERIGDYPCFNAFFTRRLLPDARPMPTDARQMACPADGRISQLGRIEAGRLIQAKDRPFTTSDLLGDQPDWARQFDGGYFLTVYLAPGEYHRFHMPCDGRLKRARFIPGRLFSVSERTTRIVPELFARNERLALGFDSPQGPVAMVLVAAMLVSGIRVCWQDEPASADMPAWPPRIDLTRGQDLGCFNWGSTVILLRDAALGPWHPELAAGTRVRVGQPLLAGTDHHDDDPS